MIVFRWRYLAHEPSFSSLANFSPSAICADLHAQMSSSCSLPSLDIAPSCREKSPDDGGARYFKRMCTLIQYALVHLSWNVWHARLSLFASCILRPTTCTRERISLSYSLLQFILPLNNPYKAFLNFGKRLFYFRNRWFWDAQSILKLAQAFCQFKVINLPSKFFLYFILHELFSKLFASISRNVEVSAHDTKYCMSINVYFRQFLIDLTFLFAF